MKFLVLDTNIFVQDFTMKGNHFNALLRNFGPVADKLAIPKVIRQEVYNKNFVEIESKVKDSNKSVSELRRCVDHEISVISDSYVKYLHKLFIDNFNHNLESVPTTIAEYPSISHEEVSNRAIRKAKPFKQNGSGYRDTIIWESLMEILQDNPENTVVFVTNNTKDFLEENSLSPDLIADLDNKSISGERIVVYSSLKSLINDRLLPQLETIQNLKKQIDNNEVPGVDINRWIEINLFELLDENDLGRILAGVWPDESKTHLSEISEIVSVHTDEAKAISERETFLIVVANINIGIEICADYYQHEESYRVKELFDYHGGTMPSPYDCVYLNSPARVEISAIVKDNDFSAASLQVRSIESPGGSIAYDN